MVHKSSSCHRHNTAVPMLLQLGKILLLLSLVAASPESLSAAQSSTKTDVADTTSTAVETALRGSKIITKPFASSTTTTTTATTAALLPAVRRLQETVKEKDDKTKEVKTESTDPTKPPVQEADDAKDKKVPVVIDANTKAPAKGESTSTTPEQQTKPQKDPQKESCESATSCASCEKISTTVKTTGNAYCRWNSTFCGTIPLHTEEDKLFVNSCPSSSSSSSSLSGGGGDNEDSSFSGRLQGFALLLAIFGVLLIVRQRIVHGRSGFHSSLDRAIDQVASSVASSTGGNSRGSRGSRYHEVPVDDDDEWGWEDSKPRVSDVELSSWRTSSGGATTAADDGMNNNASLGDSNVNAPSMKNKLSPQPIKKRMSSGDQGLLPTTSSSSSSGAAGGLPPMTISSLGKPISALSKKTDLPSQQQAPKKEEDIFASMGLAARPTFTAPSSSVTSPSMEFRRRASPPVVVANANTTNSNTGWGARNTTSTTTADPQQQQQQQGGGGDEAWDDDADLDDLLND